MNSTYLAFIGGICCFIFYYCMKSIKASFLYAFPKTIPILAGFGFVGLSYGMFANASGFSVIYPLITTMFIFGGSLEFIGISMLLSPFAPLQVFLTALMVQSRHIFYGISMLDKYKDVGLLKAYLVYGLCDETFSINYSSEIPADVDKGFYYFFVTLLNHVYWVVFSVLGAVCGEFISLNVKGLDFVMTALFTVIFTDQLMKEKRYLSGAIGIVATILSRLVFGENIFLIPAMVLILCVLLSVNFIKKEER